MVKDVFTIGCDEAGRGAWAGPIVAAAIMCRERDLGHEIKDSKELTERKRKDLAAQLTKEYPFGIGVVSPQMIDTFGISYANTLAFERALIHLKRKCQIPPQTTIKIDGRKLPINPIWIKSISFHEKGESKFKTIAAASIIAKNYRDTTLNNRGEKEPQWEWDKHKGYGTALHRSILHKLGPIVGFHRLTYRPIKEVLG